MGSGDALVHERTSTSTSTSPRPSTAACDALPNAPKDGEGEHDVEDDRQGAGHVVERDLHVLQAEVVEGDHPDEDEGEDAHLAGDGLGVAHGGELREVGGLALLLLCSGMVVAMVETSLSVVVYVRRVSHSTDSS